MAQNTVTSPLRNATPSSYDHWRAAISKLDAADNATAGRGDLSAFYANVDRALAGAETVDAVDVPDVMLRIAGALQVLQDGDDLDAAERLLLRALRGLAAMAGIDMKAARLNFYVSGRLEVAA